VLSGIVIANRQSYVSPKRHQASVADEFVDGQRVEIGTERFSLASPHVRAKGAVVFIDKVQH
jgi:hypothetical protein